MASRGEGGLGEVAEVIMERWASWRAQDALLEEFGLQQVEVC